MSGPSDSDRYEEPPGLLGRLGSACFRHRWVVLAVWAVVLVAGFTAGRAAIERFGGDGGNDAWESRQGFATLREQSPFGERIFAAVDAERAGDPAVRAAVEQARDDLSALPGVAQIVDPYTVPVPDLRSADGRTGLVAVDLVKALDEEERKTVNRAVEKRLRAIADEAPAEVTIGGPQRTRREFSEQTDRDTHNAELLALPLTLIVMVLVFRGVFAAVIPLIGAVASIAGGMLALLAWTYILHQVDPGVRAVTTVLGLGLSIDYALLFVSRYREERGRGLGEAEAIARTAATAGRTIVFSAVTVGICLASLLVFPTPFMRSVGAAGASVVLVAVCAALTLTPALLGLLRRFIRVPAKPVPDDGFFSQLSRWVQRRPMLVALTVSALLLAAATPFLHANFQNGQVEVLPAESESRRFADVLASRFPSRGVDPVTVIARAPMERVAAYAGSLATAPNVSAVRPPQQVGDVVTVDIVPLGTAQGDQAQALVEQLRAGPPDFPIVVTGAAAILVDFNAEILDALPAALAVIFLATFVLLFLMTGSVLIPLKALIMNTLSLGASFGALVWIFQDGNLAGLLNFTPVNGLETWVPVIAFAFAFGLSMDYEVFLLSRIKEIRDAGHDDDTAVSLGLQRSGPVITAAAVLMVIVFSAFATGRLLGIKELGLVLAIAVAVDATLIRCLLVPATMTLLGRWNWWAPAPLARLHRRIGISEGG